MSCPLISLKVLTRRKSNEKKQNEKKKGIFTQYRDFIKKLLVAVYSTIKQVQV